MRKRRESGKKSAGSLFRLVMPWCPGSPLARIGLMCLLLNGGVAVAGVAQTLAMNESIRVAGLMENVTDQEARIAQFIDAARRCDLEMVKKFLDKGINVNAASTSGNTALMEACAEGHVQVVLLLLDHGANLALRNKVGETAMVKAFTGKDALEIRALVKERGLWSEKEDLDWLKALLSRGDVKVLRTIMSEMPNIRRRVIEGGGLSLACLSGNVEKIKLLLDQGANPNEDNGLPLLRCVLSRSVQGEKLLLDKGAKPDEPASEPPLCMAGFFAHLELVKLLLDCGADPNIKKQDGGVTPLIESVSCVASKYDDVTKELLKRHADVNLPNTAGVTPLMLASRFGRIEAVRELLKSGADIYAVTPTSKDQRTGRSIGGDTVLMFAATGGSKPVLEVLLAKGAQVNKGNASGVTPVMVALKHGWEVAASLLLDRTGADVNVQSVDGYNALVAAAQGGSSKLLAQVFRRITNPRLKRVEVKNWALRSALFYGHGHAARWLLDRGAQARHRFTMKDADGREELSMLMLAAMGGSTDAVDLLLERGLQVDAESSTGKTPLMFALEKGHLEVADQLIKKGANPRRKTKNNYTMLMAAARGGALIFLKRFLDEGENVNARTSAGVTALHEACLGNRIEAARFLLSMGADINVATTKAGMTPLMIAVDKVPKDDTLTCPQNMYHLLS